MILLMPYIRAESGDFSCSARLQKGFEAYPDGYGPRTDNSPVYCGSAYCGAGSRPYCAAAAPPWARPGGSATAIRVSYAFIINPSKHRPAQPGIYKNIVKKPWHSQRDFIRLKLDKDGYVCAKGRERYNADVVIACGSTTAQCTPLQAQCRGQHAFGIIPIGTGNLLHAIWGSLAGNIEAAMTRSPSHGSHRVDMGAWPFWTRMTLGINTASLLPASV